MPALSERATITASPDVSGPPHLFLSYARNDLAFVQQIDQLLQGRAETWFDLRDIPPTADWWDETTQAISATEAFVFSLSPSSLAADGTCLRELALAERQGKQIICVKVAPVDRDQIPPALAKPNWITTDGGRSMKDVADDVVRAAKINLGWARTHARLTQRANDVASGAFGSQLLTTRELTEVQSRLIAGVPAEGPTMTAQLAEFVQRSRDSLRRRRRLAGAAATAVVAILAVLLTIAVHQRDASRRAERVAQSRALASASGAQLGRDRDLAVLLALRAWRESPDDAAAAAVRTAVPDFHPSERFPVNTVRSDNHSLGSESVNAVWSLALSSRGTFLAIGSADGSVRVARRTALGEADVLPGLMTDRVRSLAFSGDDRYVAAGDAAGAVAVWRWPHTAGRVPLRAFKGRSAVTTVAFSPPDAEELAVARADGSIELWRWRARKRVAVVHARQGRVTSLSYFDGGLNFVTGGTNGTAKVWTLYPRPEVLKTLQVPGGGVTSVRFLGSAEIMTGGRDGVVRFFTWQDGKQRARLHADGAITALEFDVNEGLVYAASGEMVNAWYRDAGPQERLVGHQGRVTSIVPTPDGHVITGGVDGVLRAWNVARRPDPVRLFPIGVGSFASAFDADGQRMAAAGNDGRLRVWHLSRSGNQPVVLSEGPRARRSPEAFRRRLSAVAFDPKSDRIAAGDLSGRIYVWDLRTPGASPTVVQPVRWEVQGLAFTPDGRHLAATARGRLVVVRADARPHVVAFSDPLGGGTSTCLTMSADGTLVATGDTAGKVHLWPWQKSSKTRTLATREQAVTNSIAFSPDGKYLTTGTLTGVLQVWDAKTGDAVTAQRTGRAQWGTSFTRDGRAVLSVSEGGTLFVWPWANGQRPALVPRFMRPQVPNPLVSNAAFSRDASQVVAGVNGTQFVRGCLVCGDVDRIVRRLEGKVHRPLSALERQQYGP